MRELSRRVSLEDLICEYFKKEVIADFNCEKCKVKGEISKSQEIIRFPNLLIVNAKRFVSNPYPKKLSNKIAIETDINLTHFYTDPSYDRSHAASSFFNSEKTSGRYRLRGYIDHFGEINYGHYVAYCCNKELGGWVRYNDEKVTEMDGIRFMENSAANVYVLFYERI